ncbi:MAG: hypothetical protein WCT99_11570 [Bacteroidota bacterium]|jgi:hypothetical protein
MAIASKLEIDMECVEKGRMWNDYILHFSSSLLLRRMDIAKMIVSFDVLVSLVHFNVFQNSQSVQGRLFHSASEPAELEMIAHYEKYNFYTPNEKLEVAVDFLAKPETLEFV